MSAYLRRKFLIDKKFQLIMVAKFCSLLLIGALFSAILLYILASSSTGVLFEHSRIVVKNTSELILPLLIQTGIVVTISICIIATISIIISTHRIAGPLFRLKQDIDRLTEGQIPKNFHIRTKDQLQGIAESFDAMVKELNKVISDLKVSWADLKKDFSEVIQESEPKNKQIREKINFIDKKINHFKT